MDISKFGDHKRFVWTKQHLLTVLTQGKQPIVREGSLSRALQLVDRAHFVPKEYKEQSYADVDLVFGHGQTLNSPLVIAQMLAALKLQAGQKVLELGAGTGYTTALLALCVAPAGYVFSLERSLQILEIARGNLANYSEVKNYELIFMDGKDGLAARAPYDAIYSGFAYKSVPEKLLEQLKVGGKLIVPLADMQIKLYTRVQDSEISEELIAVKHFGKYFDGVE